MSPSGGSSAVTLGTPVAAVPAANQPSSPQFPMFRIPEVGTVNILHLLFFYLVSFLLYTVWCQGSNVPSDNYVAV